MATAALRGGLVVAAIILGVFVLSKAFPSAGEAPPVTPAESPSGTPTGEQGADVSPAEPRETETPEDPSRVTLQVLNATDVDGLAAETAAQLEEAGYKVETVDDATGTYERTTLFHLPNLLTEAEALRQELFPDAVLEEAARDAEEDITVVLADDYVAAQEAQETPATEETT